MAALQTIIRSVLVEHVSWWILYQENLDFLMLEFQNYISYYLLCHDSFSCSSTEESLQMNSISLFLLIASSVSHINSKTWSLSEYFLSLNPLTQYSLFAIILTSVSSFLSTIPSLNLLFYFLLQLVTYPCHINLLKHSIYSFITLLKILFLSSQCLYSELQTSQSSSMAVTF